MVSQFAHACLEFLKSEDGPTTVEYAIQLALIIALAANAVSYIGTKSSATFNQVGNQLGKGTGS